MPSDLYTNKAGCPNCGADILFYNSLQWYYGSPLRTCRRCGAEYFDDRYHEIEIDGYEPDAFNITKDRLAAVVGLIITVVFACVHVFEVTHLTRFFPGYALLSLIGVFAMLFGITDAVMIATGRKEKRLEKLRCRSEERLKNKQYAHKLYNHGYKVPEKYL
ncbi:MAG: hypothetical protein Q4F95_16095 [Oscillospiraceae bacterium]|nr:hypothetical protein [Oscillospiraceae bacterium]